MDDTLYPEEAFVLSGFRAVAAWAGNQLDIEQETGYAELSSLYFSGIRRNTFNVWLGKYGLDTWEIVSQMVVVYREHKPNIAPYDVVPTLLAGLRRRYRLGIVSDGYLAVQQRKLNALQIASCFDAVVFSDEFGRNHWKPSTKPFREILQRLAVSGQRAMYIGDNPIKDFFGARQCGITTVWLQGNHGEYESLQPPTAEHAPDITVESRNDLYQRFLSNAFLSVTH
ncbi:MAG: HAD family hydrolase [Anaerolineae bacterium]|nr:HAD family hydrolase [Anaerolineae bacterium]MCO5204063.1 HAD family hydrolase [Anaerolineae bacterium]